jgi:hypothetical protein
VQNPLDGQSRCPDLTEAWGTAGATIGLRTAKWGLANELPPATEKIRFHYRAERGRISGLFVDEREALI